MATPATQHPIKYALAATLITVSTIASMATSGCSAGSTIASGYIVAHQHGHCCHIHATRSRNRAAVPREAGHAARAAEVRRLRLRRVQCDRVAQNHGVSLLLLFSETPDRVRGPAWVSSLRSVVSPSSCVGLCCQPEGYAGLRPVRIRRSLRRIPLPLHAADRVDRPVLLQASSCGA